MSFLSSTAMKYVYTGCGALAAVASYVGGGVLFSTIPKITKLFGETCPNDELWNPSPVVCQALVSKYNLSSLGTSGLLVGATIGAVCANYAFSRINSSAQQESGEKIPLKEIGKPLTLKKLRENCVVMAVVAGGLGVGETFLNMIFMSAIKDAAIDWGRCNVAYNFSQISCNALESTTSSIATANYVLTGIVGSLLFGTVVFSSIKAIRSV